jgi:hypothetical protein
MDIIMCTDKMPNQKRRKNKIIITLLIKTNTTINYEKLYIFT